MFTNVTNRQLLADQFKCWVEPAAKRKADHVWRGRARAAIKMFERNPWYPQALEQAMQEAAPGRFSRPADEIVDAGGEASVYEAVARLLERYHDLIGMALYTTEAASLYLDMPMRTIKHHLHTSEKLKGAKIGHDLYFTRETLNTFAATERPTGRPRKQPEGSR